MSLQPDDSVARVALVAELREVRRLGPDRLAPVSRAPLPTMRAILAELADTPRLDGMAEATRWPPRSLVDLLRAAIERLPADSAPAAAAAPLLGLAPGTRGKSGNGRRRDASTAYHVEIDQFRKRYEPLVLAALADAVLELRGEGRPGPGPALAKGTAPRAPGGETPGAHDLAAAGPRTWRVLAGTTAFPVTVHLRPIQLLKNVDVIVSSENVYFEIASLFKSSVSAAIRRSAAQIGPAGDVQDDVVRRELSAWREANRVPPGRPVAPGTVVATSGGALRGRNNIRWVYHAAVTMPRPNSNGYDVDPATVSLAAANVFERARRENASGAGEPLRSVCFPLLGSGRGGLDPRESLKMIWASVVDDVRAYGHPWEVHFVAHRADIAALICDWIDGVATRHPDL